MTIIRRRLLIMLFLFVFVEGVLLTVASSSNIINRDDTENLPRTMEEKYRGISKDINKRSPTHYRNFSNYFQGQYMSSCKSCGLINSKKQNFLIIKGDVVDPPYKYPWMVRLRGFILRPYGTKKRRTSKFCGGSIINEYYILTAAHCLEKIGGPTNPSIPEYLKPENLNVEFLTNTYSVTNGSKVEKIIPHPQYNRQIWKHDIGLVKLKDKIICDMYKNPVCLPPSNLKLPERTVVKVAGWGKTETEVISEKLKDASLRYVNFATCRNYYEGVHLVEGTKYCLKGIEGNLQITCRGDSGGPAFYENGGKYYVIGLSSTSSGDCGVHHPATFTAVPKYVNWIKQVTESSSDRNIYLEGKHLKDDENIQVEEKEEERDVRE